MFLLIMRSSYVVVHSKYPGNILPMKFQRGIILHPFSLNELFPFRYYSLILDSVSSVDFDIKLYK